MNISESDRQIIVGALDSLGVALADEKMRGLDCSHIEVDERDGTVEGFDLIAHPKAKRAFAWSYREDEQDKTTVVLEIPPVDSAHGAVMIAIASMAP
jgi:hypothetical protein